MLLAALGDRDDDDGENGLGLCIASIAATQKKRLKNEGLFVLSYYLRIIRGFLAMTGLNVMHMMV